MAQLRIHGFTLLSLLCVVACGPDKDTTATMATTTGTDSNSSVPGTTVGPDGETPASEPTSTTTTTGPSVTSSTSPGTSGGSTVATTGPGETDSTTGEACVIEVPPPGSCNGVAPLKKRPASGLQLQLPKSAGEEEPFAASTGTSGTTTDGETGCQFICEPDAGSGQECDLFAQDCAEGEKCNAWANDGGGSWNATKCVPVDPNPAQVGEPCTVEGSGVSGVDSCAKGAMCWNTDENNMGTCIALCTCSIEQPICEVVNTQCTIANQGVIVLCLPVCDPLNQVACAPGEVCIQSGDTFSCVVDASGEEGQEGDGCSFANACDPGLFCGAAGAECFDPGCCSPFCALDNPSCPAGKECVPWFEEGAAPMCFEDLGACVDPI